jgi:hypothetical protein
MQSFKRLDVWKHEFRTQLRNQRGLEAAFKKVVETSKDRLQDALDQGARRVQTSQESRGVERNLSTAVS